MKAFRSLAPLALAFSVAGTAPVFADQGQVALPEAQSIIVDPQAVADLAREVAELRTRLERVENISRALEISDLVDTVAPASANIFVTQRAAPTQASEAPEFSPPSGSPFEEFFNQFRNSPPPPPRGGGSSLGSGFVIDGTEGYIVTNNHVISAGGDEPSPLSEYRIVVNGRSFEATLVGFSNVVDLAVLKVDVDGLPLPEVRFADSNNLRIGSLAIAIGNPLGVGQTVSTGVISGLNRQIGSSILDDYIQTDAAINRGNSGGPLYNIDGEVIGVNTAIFSPNGGSIGIGFSIPANLTRFVVESLIEHGTAEFGRIGIVMTAVTPDAAANANLADLRGVLVQDIAPDSPAQAAGIQPGDIITAIDGVQMDDLNDLRSRVMTTRPGTDTAFTVIRNGNEISVPVTIGKLETEGMAVNAPQDGLIVPEDEAPEAPEAPEEAPEAPAPEAPAPAPQSYSGPTVRVPSFAM